MGPGLHQDGPNVGKGAGAVVFDRHSSALAGFTAGLPQSACDLKQS